ncbi:hypothetical protein [Methylotuvimicrobium sp. KM1]|uniref:hypothetical protein n=1 Tax=Methylotuvimicrobium sp. KM1 TaxID=3377707 RepID=UPI00384EA87E
MRYVYLTLNWVFGVFFLLIGLPFIGYAPLAGGCMFAAAALLLPPVRSFVYSKTNKALPVKARAISIFALFLAFGFFDNQAKDEMAQELAAQQAREKAEKAAELRQKNINYFNANREQIIYSVKKALSGSDYQSVISQSNKYLVSGDKELEQMNAQAKKEFAAIQKAEKTENLLAEVKGVPTNEYEKNLSFYQQLFNLHPKNELYKTKVAFYAGKIEEEKLKHAAVAVAAAEAQRLAAKWSYQVSDDPMSSRKAKYASIISENAVSFDFPYQGLQRGKLMLRDHPTYGNNVIFSIERGQILCESYSDCTIRIRFDNGSSTRWGAVGPSDHSNTSIFLRNESGFVKKMRAAKIVRLQVPIYQEGEPIFEFHVGGYDAQKYKNGKN